MKVVSPYRPFEPESEAHLRLGPFDWVDALKMLRKSVRRSCGVETYAITDHDSPLSVPAYSYHTEHRRLMLWILEVSLRYLESKDFNQDTVMVSPDILVFAPLQPYFTADITVILRLENKYVAAERPLLNSVQWWRLDAKKRLAAFYRKALDIAVGLPEEVIKWGADTAPLVELLSPLQPGYSVRSGLSVCALDQTVIMDAFSTTMRRWMDGGCAVRPNVPLLDFRYERKQYMRQYFDQIFKPRVQA